MNWIISPVGCFPSKIESLPSVSIRISGFVCLKWRHCTCVTFWRNAEWRAVRTENTYRPWAVSGIGSRALSCGYIYPVRGEEALEFSLHMLFPSFGYSRVLKANDEGSLFEDLVDHLFTSFVSVRSYIPRYHFRIRIRFYGARDLEVLRPFCSGGHGFILAFI